MDTNQQKNSRVPSPWQPRFTLGSMLMVMFVVSIASAAASYFVQALRSGGAAALFASHLFLLVAPILVLILVSLSWQISKWLSGRRRR